MRALRLGMAALSAAMVLGFAAGCQQGDAEAQKATDGKLSTHAKRLDALEGAATGEAPKADSNTSLSARLRALELKMDGVAPSATPDAALLDRISKLEASLASATVGAAPTSPDAAAMLKPTGDDKAVNPAFMDQLKLANAVIEAERATATRKRMRDDSMQRFDRRMEQVAKDKGLSAGEVSAVKDIYSKHYDASAALMETAWGGGGRWGFGGTTDAPEVTQEQRQAARDQLTALRTETEASLKAAVPADAYDSVQRTVMQQGGGMRIGNGDFTGAIETVRGELAGLAGTSAPAPAAGTEGGSTATPRPRTRGGDNSGGGGTRGNRGNGGNGNGN